LFGEARRAVQADSARVEASIHDWHDARVGVAADVAAPMLIKVLSDMTLTAPLRRVNVNSDTPGRIATAHGFRSSFRDWASEPGDARDLAERALAHTVSNKVEAAYHRTDLLEQRRVMMQAWAEHVCGGAAAQVIEPAKVEVAAT